VTAVYDPGSALQVVRRLEPEIAVVDIDLPVMDGYQLIGRLREALGARRSALARACSSPSRDTARMPIEAAAARPASITI
jgi:CheY-like chemotaxis protein